MREIIQIIILAFIIQTINAQNQIKGKITDENNQPLVGATVYVPLLNKGTSADKNGDYIIKDLPNGEVNFQVSYVGYGNKIESIILNKSSLELNFKLKQTAVETEEIVVTGGYNATQHENAVKIDILKPSPLETKITPGFAEILMKIPGVDMISKGSGVSKPVIRGLSMNDILVLNNGFRFENYQYSDHHPLGIDEFGIDEIEVIKGPASLLYGSDAIGGVINFIKEKPAEIGKISGDYNLQLFSNSLGATNNLGIKGSTNNFHAGLRFGNKTNADYLQGGGEFVPNTRFFGNTLKANLGYSNQNFVTDWFYDYSQYKVGLAEEDAIDYVKETGRGRNPEVYYMSLGTNQVSTRNKIFFNNYKLEINASYQNSGLIHTEGADEISIDMDLQTLLYETRLNLPSSNKNEYIVGFQGMNQVNTNRNNREIILLPDAATNNYSGFGLLQFSLFDKLKVQTGLRYDYKTINTETTGVSGEETYRQAINKNFGSFSGSAGTTYNLNEKLLFRMNFASAYRTPNLPELTSNGLHETRYEMGDETLLPENSYETDFSMHYHISNFRFDGALFYNSLKNYIYISPTENLTSESVKIYQYMQSDAMLYGFEAGMHFHPGFAKWFHFEGSYANVTGKKTNGEFLPFIPANKIIGEVSLIKDKFGKFENSYLKFNSQTAFAQNNPAPEEDSTPGYTVFDVYAGTNIDILSQKISLAIGATNVFDIKYVDHLSTLKEVGYFNPGRSVVFSLKVPFNTK